MQTLILPESCPKEPSRNTPFQDFSMDEPLVFFHSFRLLSVIPFACPQSTT